MIKGFLLETAILIIHKFICNYVFIDVLLYANVLISVNSTNNNGRDIIVNFASND